MTVDYLYVIQATDIGASSNPFTNDDFVRLLPIAEARIRKISRVKDMSIIDYVTALMIAHMHHSKYSDTSLTSVSIGGEYSESRVSGTSKYSTEIESILMDASPSCVEMITPADNDKPTVPDGLNL